MIEVKNLYYYYTKDYYALFDISFNVDKNEHVAILGDVDSGKTSLLRLLVGLEKFSKGEININGMPIKRVDFANSFHALFISSRGVFLENKSCKKNIEYVLKMRGEKIDNIKIESALNTYGLGSYKDTRAKDLNAFNRVMLQLARASFRDKLDLIVVDDVFSGLAYSEREHVIKHLKPIVMAKNVTSVVACSEKEVAEALSKRIIKLKLGSIEK